MPAKTFGIGKLDPCGRDAGKAAGVTFDRGRPLHEIDDAEPGREFRRPCRRQDMVWPGDIIADGFRRVTAKEDGAGMPDPAKPASRLANGKFQMFGGDAVGQSRHVIHRSG